MLHATILAILLGWTSSELQKTDTAKSVEKEVFSFAPNNTPVTRVYVLGRPIYVRQPFVIPQRDLHEIARYERKIVDEELQKLLSAPDLFTRKKKLRDYYSPPGDSYPKSRPVPKYPLPQCYTNDSGFMCCNQHLETAMKQAFDELAADPKWKNCNTQTIANALQKRCQSIFSAEFEAIAGIGDFASKAHFYSDYICKIERGGRFMMAYGTPNRHSQQQRTIPYLHRH